MKKIILILFFTILSFQTITASNLAVIGLEDASNKELALMCSLRNLDCGSSREQMIEKLKEVLNDESTLVEQNESAAADNSETANPISFSIESANSLKRVNGENELILLTGDVILVFKIKDEETKLSAETIVIDTENSKLAALGNVTYSTGNSDNNLLAQDISGEIVTLNWDTNKIQVSGGSIYTERKNSEDETVVFNAISSLLTLNTVNNSLILENGFITTNPETAYSSISASKIALLDHGDMYLENARVSIGRVDVLYLPFFFSPGATMIGNPSIGYESNRGAFVNTTFELLGKYPNFKSAETNSFTSLLQSEDSADTYANGAIYNSNEEPSEFQTWAKDTDSYFTLFLDAYEKTPYSIEDEDSGSVVIGYASQINLINKALKITSTAITSFASDGLVGDLPSYDAYPIFRYDAALAASLKFNSGTINISMPLISDPLVRKTYGNRLSSFTIDALWNNQSFPTTYSSDVTSYTWGLDAQFNFTPKFLNPIIQKITISKLKANIDYEWEKIDNNYTYHIDEMTLPEVELILSGDILSLSQSEKIQETIEEEKSDDEAYEILRNLYKSSIKEESVNTDLSFYDLSYNLKNNFYYTDSQDDSESEIYEKSYLTLTSSAQVEPNILEVNNTTSFNYIYNNDYDEYELNSFDILTKNVIKLPFINLSYYFDSRLYKYRKTYEDGTSEEETLEFEFGDDYITTHEIEWQKAYNINDLKLTPSLKFVLPPLSLALKPSLTLNYKEFENKTVFTFDIDSSSFELAQVDDYIKYSKNNFNFDFDISYDILNSKTANRLLDSLVLKSSIIYYNKTSNQYLGYSSKYYGLYDGESEDYFSDLSFTYKNSFISSKLNFYSLNSQIKLDYFKNTISLSDYTKYWWKNRIGLKLNVDATFNYSFVDKYSTYLSLTGDLSFKIAEFMLLDLSITTSNYGFYTYYDINNNFDFGYMFSDLMKSFDIFGEGRSSTQFNLEEVSLDFIHMMEDWDLHCKYTGSVVLSNYNYQWIPTVSIFLQWKTIPELKVDQSFTNDGEGWSYNS